MKMNLKKFFHISLLVSALAMLAGCDFLKKGCSDCTTTTTTTITGPHDSAKVLATINGKSLVTEGQFNKYVDQLMKFEPQMELYFAMVPDMPQKLFEMYEADLLIKEWLKHTGKDKDADYREKLEMQKQLVESQMQGQKFQEYVIAQIPQDDNVIAAFYEEKKKTLPLFQQAPFVKTAGGVKAQGISFSTEKQAKEFLDKVTAAGADFAAIAKEDKKTINNFGGKPVNAQSTNVDSAVRSKLADIKKFPATELIKADKNFWVVKATSKTETEYAPLADVKDAAKNVLLQTKFNDEMKNQLDAIKSEYKIDDAAAKAHFAEVAAKREAELQEQAKAIAEEQEREALAEKEAKASEQPSQKAEAAKK